MLIHCIQCSTTKGLKDEIKFKALQPKTLSKKRKKTNEPKIKKEKEEKEEQSDDDDDSDFQTKKKVRHLKKRSKQSPDN